MATHLDTQVTAFHSRPLDQGPYTFVWVDALTVKVREDGGVVNVHALIATGVNADGHREIQWNSARPGRRLRRGRGRVVGVLRGLVDRCLSGVQLVISAAHPGLVAAIGSALPGASWQRSSVNINRGGRFPLVHLRRRERTLAA
jgi:putative transposase